MIHDNRPLLRAMTLVLGIVTCLVGLIFISVPAIVRFGNEWILAALMIGGAIMTAGFAVTTLRQDVRFYTSLMTATSLATGVIILVHPLDTVITLTTLLGIYFMLESGLWGGLGMSVRPNWSISGILLFCSLTSFVMSMLIWLRIAGAPKSVLVSLLGISFVCRGLAYVIISLMMKSMGRLVPTEAQSVKTETNGV